MWIKVWSAQEVCSAYEIEWTSESMNVWANTCHIPKMTMMYSKMMMIWCFSYTMIYTQSTKVDNEIDCDDGVNYVHSDILGLWQSDDSDLLKQWLGHTQRLIVISFYKLNFEFMVEAFTKGRKYVYSVYHWVKHIGCMNSLVQVWSQQRLYPNNTRVSDLERHFEPYLLYYDEEYSNRYAVYIYMYSEESCSV